MIKLTICRKLLAPLALNLCLDEIDHEHSLEIKMILNALYYSPIFENWRWTCISDTYFKTALYLTSFISWPSKTSLTQKYLKQMYIQISRCGMSANDSTVDQSMSQCIKSLTTIGQCTVFNTVPGPCLLRVYYNQ